MASGKVTIYDVAKTAGVSTATVSQTLNRPGQVNTATRQRVLDVIDELGYVPKAAAASYARKSVGRIGALAPFTAYDSFNRRLMGALAEAQASDNELVVYDQLSAGDASSPVLSAVPIAGRLDGLLIMGLPLDDTLVARLDKTGLPTVLIDSHRAGLTSVTIDDEAAGHLVGQHLLDHGYEALAYLMEPAPSFDYRDLQGAKRFAGMRRAVAEAGKDPDDVQLVHATLDIEGAGEAVRQWSQSGDAPRAVFAQNDTLAAGVVRECRRLGISVPGELAVAGFDDGPLAEAMEITTVRQPLEESGRIGTRLLCDTIAGRMELTQRVLLDVQLVVRATT